MMRHGTYPPQLNIRLQGKGYRWPRRRNVPEWFFWPAWNPPPPGASMAYYGYLEERPSRSIIDGRPIYPERLRLPDGRKSWKARR